MAYHAGLPVPGGFTGVDVFFVVSGFVITRMLRRELVASGRIRLGRFYLRRFKRLTPALAVAVSVTLLLSALLLSPFGPQQTVARTAIGTMLLSANATIARSGGGYFDDASATNPLLHAWSLSVEEQFYLVFPLLLYLGWTLSRRTRTLRPAILVGAIAGASFALAVLGSAPRAVSPTWLVGFYSPLSRAWEFGAGAVLGLTAAGGLRFSRPVSTSLGALGSALLVASLWLVTDDTPFPGTWTLLPVAGTLFLLIAGADPANPVSRLLSVRPLVAVGDGSYSIYLWHWPFVVFAAHLRPDDPAALAIATLFSLLPALASFRWVEQPLRERVLRSRREAAFLVAGTILVPIGLAGMLGLAARAAWWTSWPASARARSEDHAVVARGCNDAPFDPKRCSWNSDGSDGTVLLVGDSQAFSFADGVVAAASRLGMRTVVSSRSGCPFALVDTSGEKALDCRAWQREVLDYALTEPRPALVAIANRSSRYTRAKLGARRVLDGTGRPASPQAAPRLYEDGLDEVVGALRDAGIAVLVVQSIPEPGAPTLRANTSLLRRIAPAVRAPESFVAAPFRAGSARAAEVEARVAAAHPGTFLFDPIPRLCPDGSCPLTVDGRSVYLDSTHLTREGSLLLADSLAGAMGTALADRSRRGDPRSAADVPPVSSSPGR